MIVYHGTDNYSAENIIKTGIDLKIGKKYVDNGQGFYTTQSREFAARRAAAAVEDAKDYREEDPRPVLLQIEFDENAFDNLNIAIFTGCTYEWKEFVFFNRMGTHFLNHQKIASSNHNLDFKFDIVIDETADSGVTKIIQSLKYTRPRYSSDWKSQINKIKKSKKVSWSNQISFHSIRALQCIKSMQIVEV